ncbi:MAG: lytic transglycosylase domain-containing protein [Sulfitobacter sp.]
MGTHSPHQSDMRYWVILLVGFWTQIAVAEPPDRQCSTAKWGQIHCIRPAHFVYDTCNAIQIFAKRHKLNRDFFARLIWQESRFDPNALSHANARGIAQFIPSTAALRGLADPYNPADALDHSAQYLAEMVTRYGNEGLAAVGYNGGERRVAGFLDGGGLADETINYVPIITGLTAQMWRDTPPKAHDFRLSKTQDFLPACYAIAQNRRLTPLARPDPLVKPWGVQLAFGKTKSQARATYTQRTASCRSLLSKEKPDYLNVKHRASRQKGFVMARIGRNTRKAADQLCASLRRAGCICAVYKNK